MATPHSPDTFDVDDLRAVEDDPLALDNRDDAPALVAALAPTTFVQIARRLREEHRLDLLLPHATPYQLTSLLDLDGWVRDRVDIRRARVWLYEIAHHAVAGHERGALTDLIYQMDPEVWSVALAAGTVVADITPDQDDSRDDILSRMGALRTWESPDGFFVLGVPDDELGRTTLRTIRRVYDDDLDEGRKLCLSIQSLSTAEAEEDLLRFRQGRLAELGFVEWEQAMQLLRPLDHRVAAEHEALDFAHLHGAEPPRPVKWRGPAMLRHVMERLSPNEHGLRSREFLLLVAEVMSAQRFDPGDEARQERAIEQTQATISLGFELLAQEAPQAMEVEAFLAERVSTIGLRLVFRVGFGALDKLRSAARVLHRGGRVSLQEPGSLLDRPWGPTVAALLGVFPELANTEGKGTRPLVGLPDVAAATLRLTQASALSRLCFESDGYAVDPVWIDRVDEPQRLTLGDLVRTAIVHAHLPGSSGALAPLTREDLAWAQQNLLEGQALADRVSRDFAQRCADLGIGEHQSVLADSLLTRLQVELASLEQDLDGHVDLTRVGGMITVQNVGVWLRMRHGDGGN